MCGAYISRVVFISEQKDIGNGVLLRLRDHIEPQLTDSPDITGPYFLPANCAEEFQAVMRILESEVENVGVPLINLYYHGNPEQGIRFSNGKYISWSEVNDMLRNINTLAQNTMCVVSACCYSLHSILPPDVTKASPYSFLLAPSTEITEGEIESQLYQFYTLLLKHKDISPAVKELSSFRKFLPELYIRKAFVKALTSYHGRSGSKEREEAMTRAKAIFPGLDKSKYRKIMKNYGKENRDQIVSMVTDTFMCGRPFCPAVQALTSFTKH